MDYTLVFSFVLLFISMLLMILKIHQLEKRIDESKNWHSKFPKREFIDVPEYQAQISEPIGMNPQQIDEPPAPFFIHETDRP